MKADITDPVLFKLYLENTGRFNEASMYVYKTVIESFLKTSPDIDKISSYNKFMIEKNKNKRNLNYYSILRTFIEYKFKEKKKQLELIDGLIIPEYREYRVKERIYLEEEKIIEVINGLKSRKHMLLAIIMNATGIRIGDILTLKRGNIINTEHEGEPVLQLNLTGKGKKMNVVTIHDETIQDLLIDYISNYYHNDEYYFIEPIKYKRKKNAQENTFYNTIKYNYNKFLYDLKDSLRKCGIEETKFASHDIRRCFARRVWNKYKDLVVLQSLLKHTDPKVTIRYLETSGLQNIDYYKQLQS